jgi:hypothetical protein
MRSGGKGLLRVSHARLLRAVAALALLTSVSSGGFAALAVPAHALSPAPTLAAPLPPSLSNDPTPSIAFSGGGTAYECSFTLATAAASWTTCTSPWTAPAPSPPQDGDFLLSVREASATNDGIPAQHAYTLDTVAEVTVDVATPGSSATPTWTISVEPGGSATCTLDGTPVGSCSTGYTPSAPLSGEGPHVLGIDATDGAANTATAASTYVLDTTAPAPPTVTGSSGTARTPSVSWTWPNPGGDQATCTLTGPAGVGAPEDCTTRTGFTRSLSTDGEYGLAVVLRDAAGNASSPASLSPLYTLDTAPPAAPVFASSPTSPGTTVAPTWTFSTPGATTRCHLVGTTAGIQPDLDCASGSASPSLPRDDGWTLVVTTADAYGNTISTSSPTYVLDTTGPTAPSVAGPTGVGNDAAPHYVWDGELPSTAECRLVTTDTAGTALGPWTRCDARFYDPTLTRDAVYRVEVRITDPLGNLGGTGTSGSYTYDGTKPAQPVVAGPPTLGSDPTPVFTFAVEPGASALCRVSPDAVPSGWSSCSSGSYAPTLPGDGPYVVEVVVTDAAGNPSPAGTREYTLDSTKPGAPTLTSPPSPSSDRAPSWGISGDGTSTLTCRFLRGATVVHDRTPCASGYLGNLTGEPDATYVLEVTATDTAANTTVVMADYVLDTAAPAAASVTGPRTPNNLASPTWTFPVQVGTTAQCRLVQGLSVGGWVDCSAGRFTANDLADGTYTVDALVTDLAGNQGPLASSGPYTSDRTAPAAPVVAGPSGPGNNPSPTWTWTGEAGTTATCRLDRAGVVGGAVPCPDGAFSPALTGDTTYVVVIVLTDAAGNPSTPTTTAVYTLDTALPAAPVVSGRSGAGSVGTPVWTWSAETDATSYCQLVRNGVTGALATCTSGTPVPLPSDGTYVLQVQVVDAAGNKGPLGSSASYTYDSAAPAAPVVTAPASPSNVVTPTYSFTSEPGAATSCRLLHAGVKLRDWAPCTSPAVIDLTGGPEGSYVVEVRATDAAGNMSPVGEALPYLLDITVPDAPVVSVPSGPARNSTPTVTWTGEAGTTATCRLVHDGIQQATAAPCATPWAAVLGSDGQWQVRVRLIDAAGNLGNVGVSGLYVLDTTPPATPVLTAPAGPGRDTAPSWSAVVEAGSTTECRLSDASATVLVGWASCRMPHTTDLSGRGDGTYVLDVRAIDAVGLTSPPASGSYQLDTTQPAPPVFGALPASPSRSRSATFTFTAEQGATVTCRLTIGAVTISPETACTSPLPVSLAGLADGAYTLSARATDAAGNTGAAQTVTHVLDTSAPAAPVLVTGPAPTAPDRTPAWAFTAETGSTVTCRLSGVTVGVVTASTSCSSPFASDLTSQPDDTYTFTARATDEAGNISAALTSSYLLDATAPTTASVVGPTSPGQATSPTWQVSSSEGTVQCRLVKGTLVVRDWASCGPTYSVPLALTGDGTYTMSARVVDAAGNLSAEVVSRYVLDTTPPAPAILTTPVSPATDRAPTWTVASPDLGATASCQVLGPGGAVVRAFAPCAVTVAGSPYDLNLTDAVDGGYTLVVRLTDTAGNTGSDARGTYVLDTGAPNTVLISIAPAQPSSLATPTWQFVGDSDSVLECRLTGPGLTAQTFVPCAATPGVPGSGSFTADLTNRPDGTYVLSLRSRDTAGNVGPETTSAYLLDRIAPPTPAAPVAPSALSREPVVVWNFVVEAGATALCTLSSASQTVYRDVVCGSPWTTDLSAYGDGDYTLTLRARDQAGNTSDAVNASYRLDRRPPPAPLITHTPGTPGPETKPVWNLQPGEVGGFLECQLSGTGIAPVWTRCTDAFSYDLSGSTGGVYLLQARQHDDAGNVSETVTSIDYVFDPDAPPTPSVLPPLKSPSNSTSPVFRLARKAGDVDTVSLRCTAVRSDGGPAPTVRTCAFGQTTVVLGVVAADSEFTVGLTVAGVDQAGNVGGGESALYQFDNRAPAAPRIKPLDAPHGLTPDVVWTFERLPDAVRYECLLARKGSPPPAPEPCELRVEKTLPSYGEWTLTVVARDAAGNSSPASTSTYTYLPPVPVVTGIKAPAAGPDSTPTWTFTVPRGYTASCMVSDARGATVSAGDCSRGTYTADLAALPPGTYTLSVLLTDAFDNSGATPSRSAYRYAPKTMTDGHIGQPGPGTPPARPGPPTSSSDTPGTAPTGPGTSTTAGDRPRQGTASTAKPGTVARPDRQIALVPRNVAGGFIPTEVPKAIAKTVTEAISKPTIPLLLLAVVVGFLLLQNQIDRRDPKLSSAPVGAEPELDFGPVLGSSPTRGRPLGGGALA